MEAAIAWEHYGALIFADTELRRIAAHHRRVVMWSLLVGPDDVRSLVKVPSDTWSRMDLPTAVNTQRVTLEIARPDPDDFVHVNEVEFYEPADAALAPPSE